MQSKLLLVFLLMKIDGVGERSKRIVVYAAYTHATFSVKPKKKAAAA